MGDPLPITPDRPKDYIKGDEICPDCGADMGWCSACGVWTKNCCIDYGTCLCS